MKERKFERIIKTNYNEDLKVFKETHTWVWTLGLVLGLCLIPMLGSEYLLHTLSLAGVYVIVALALNLLSGYAGQISLGHAAFLAVGAYSSAVLTMKFALSFWLALPLSGFITTIVGLVVGLPALRLSGIYLAIVTLAFGFIVDEVIIQAASLTNGVNGIAVSKPSVGPMILGYVGLYYLILIFVILGVYGAKNITRSAMGRAFVAIRDSEIAAEILGVNLSFYKMVAFAISAFYTGVAGSLFAHLLGFIAPENFTLMDSITFIMMVLVGGAGSLLGSIYGATFITFLPEGIRLLKDVYPSVALSESSIQGLLYGFILLFFIIVEPNGLYGRWVKIKRWWKTFPL